jgi:hypothetical protein
MYMIKLAESTNIQITINCAVSTAAKLTTVCRTTLRSLEWIDEMWRSQKSKAA